LAGHADFCDLVELFDPREEGELLIVTPRTGDSQFVLHVTDYAGSESPVWPMQLSEFSMLNKFMLAPPALALALAFSASAQAAITVYTTQASYLAAISAPGVDTYDDLDPNQSLVTPQTRAAGAYAYTVSVGPNSEFFPAGTFGGDAWLSSDDRLDTVTFDGFSSSVRGIGGYFFRTNNFGALSGLDATINLSATDSSGTFTQSLMNPTLSSFVGFVSTSAFSNVKFWVGEAGTGVADVWASVNDLTLGAAAVAPPVPEPETYALMLGGLALLGTLIRRKKL
jgi:PEP-CTERM motif